MLCTLLFWRLGRMSGLDIRSLSVGEKSGESRLTADTDHPEGSKTYGYTTRNFSFNKDKL